MRIIVFDVYRKVFYLILADSLFGSTSLQLASLFSVSLPRVTYVWSANLIIFSFATLKMNAFKYALNVILWFYFYILYHGRL